MKSIGKLAVASVLALFGFVVAADTLPKVVTGGLRVTDWSVDAKGRWHAKLPAGTRSSHFFVNGRRRTRPTLPRTGWFYMDENPAGSPGRQRFAAREGQVPSGFDCRGVEACVVHDWNMSRLPVAGYDPGTRLFTCDAAPTTKAWESFGRTRWYRLENVRSALGEPGDWYLDESGELTYVPCAGETPATAEAWLGVRDRALVIDGQTNVVIRGVTFAYTGWNMPPHGQKDPQAGTGVPAAVLVTHSRNVRFEDCAFVHTGGYGLEFGPGAEDCAAVRCEFADLGAGGVKIGSGFGCGNRPETWASGCTVEECLVEHGGRFEPAGVGIWIGNAHGCRIVRNTIRDLYYTGISCGWTWDRKPSGAYDNLIAGNDISDIGQRRLMDMGGIYLLGEQKGTRVVGNVIHGVTTSRGCGFSLYFDQGCAFIEAVSNTVCNGEYGTLYLQYNTASNVVSDNVFAGGRTFMLRHWSEPGQDRLTFPSKFERNVIWWDDPLCELANPPVASPRYIAAADNVCSPPRSKRPVGTPGMARRSFSRPKPLCAAGRTVPRALTKDLPPVPAVFDEAPPVDLGDAVYAWGYVLERTPTACPFVTGETDWSLERAAEFLNTKKVVYMNSMFNRDYIAKNFPSWDAACFTNVIDGRLSEAQLAKLAKSREIWCALEHTAREASADRIAKLSLRYPNIAGINLDDFNNGMPATAMTPLELKALRDRIRAINPKLRIMVVSYAHPPLKCDLKPFRGLIDVVSRWCWKPTPEYWDNYFADIETLRAEVGPGVKVLQGIYLVDFGRDMDNPRPQDVALFEKSVRTVHDAILNWKLNGVIVPQAGWFGKVPELTAILKKYGL